MEKPQPGASIPARLTKRSLMGLEVGYHAAHETAASSVHPVSFATIWFAIVLQLGVFGNQTSFVYSSRSSQRGR